MKELRCFGNKLIDLFDVLSNPEYYKHVFLSANEDIQLRNENGIKYLREDLARIFIKTSSQRHLRDRDTILKLDKCVEHSRTLSDYTVSGEILIDASYGLSKHIEDCRKRGKCLDKYFQWLLLESRKRKLTVQRLDLRTLDILVE